MKKIVKKFGQRGAHIIMPKEFIGQEVEVTLLGESPISISKQPVKPMARLVPDIAETERSRCSYFDHRSYNCRKHRRTCTNSTNFKECECFKPTTST